METNSGSTPSPENPGTGNTGDKDSIELKRVVVIDDDLFINNMLVTLLTYYGHKVKSVQTDFRQVYNKGFFDGYEVAIIDYMLSELEGKEILQYLKDNYPSIRRILFSAKGDIGDDVISLADTFYLKPLSIDALLYELGPGNGNE